MRIHSLQTLLRSEAYELTDGAILRHVAHRNGATSTTQMAAVRHGLPEDILLDAAHDAHWLSSPAAPASLREADPIRVVDVFAGAGGLTLGIAEACRALGLRLDPLLAVDIEQDALDIYSQNFSSAEVLNRPVEELVRIDPGSPLTAQERRLQRQFEDVDLLIGGPPCQGHSDLNNHTRWVDPKNELYLSMARFAEVLQPKHVVIENVPGVVKDRSDVAQRTWDRLRELGYYVDSGVLDASKVGAAQLRRRSITIASRVVNPSIVLAEEEARVEQRDLRWAIGDLVGKASTGTDPFDAPPVPNADNQRRIDFLFDNDLHDLPNSERPDCHRLKKHTYVSMYGRLRWDKPAPTVTTGFGSMGRGRFVHPGERRLLTPREGARIQGFPDFFSFGGAARTRLYKVIGNAVPPKLGYAVGLHLLR